MRLNGDAEGTRARELAKLNGIFHQWLHERNGHELSTSIYFFLNCIFQPVGEAYFFNLRITLQRIQFLPKRLPGIATAQRKPQIVGECLRDRSHFLRFITDSKN